MVYRIWIKSSKRLNADFMKVMIVYEAIDFTTEAEKIFHGVKRVLLLLAVNKSLHSVVKNLHVLTLKR